MNIEHYQAFENFDERGLKVQASTSIRAFIDSFNNEKEKSDWVWKYLPSLKLNYHARIRHEIFHELVYPVLKAGYDDNDFACTLWLGKLAQNIYQFKNVHEELNWVSEIDLYNKCYEIDPKNDEVRLLLLQSIIEWLKYSEHEYPSGILYGNNGATLEECHEISTEVQKAVELDKEGSYKEFIKQYEKKLDAYKAGI